MLDETNKLINSPIKLRVKNHKYILESNPTIVFFSVTNLVEDQFPPFESDKIAENLVNNVPKYRGYTKKIFITRMEKYQRYRRSSTSTITTVYRERKKTKVIKSKFGSYSFQWKTKNCGYSWFIEAVSNTILIKVSIKEKSTTPWKIYINYLFSETHWY